MKFLIERTSDSYNVGPVKMPTGDAFWSKYEYRWECGPDKHLTEEYLRLIGGKLEYMPDGTKMLSREDEGFLITINSLQDLTDLVDREGEIVIKKRYDQYVLEICDEWRG